MPRKTLLIVGIVLFVTAIFAAVRFAPPHADLPEKTSPQIAVAALFPATISDRQIQAGQNLIEKSPADAKGYNLLCAAFMKKARETGDFNFNAKAEIALNRSFETATAENNYDALKLKAMLLLVYHRFDEALETARQAKEIQPDEAKKQYDLLEFIERDNAPSGKTYSRLLAIYYADHDIKLDEALEIAQSERAKRSDIYTCDALAWTLYKKGEFAEAKKAIDEALRLKTQDARINYHAGMIEQSLGNHAGAIKHLQLALKINPAFDVLQAAVAKQKLSELNA